MKGNKNTLKGMGIMPKVNEKRVGIIKNNIRQMIIVERANIELSTGIKTNLKDVYTKIAGFVGCKDENIAQLYKGNNSGSLYVAFKLAKYFDCKVEDLFYIED